MKKIFYLSALTTIELVLFIWHPKVSRRYIRKEQEMAFSESTKQKALEKAGYKCEKCGKSVTMGTCEAHHKHSVKSGGGDELSNCQILCKKCHQETRSYGKH